MRDDYFAIWKRIREHAPVYDAGEGVFLVTEWDLVNSALRNPILRAGSGVSAAFGQDSPVESVVRNWLMSLNGDEHRLARGLVSRVFSPRSLAQLEPIIRQTARTLIRPFIETANQRPADFVAAVASKLPSEVVRNLFAIDALEWATHVEPLFLGETVHRHDGFAAVQGLTPYFQDKIQQSRGQRTGGIVDMLSSADKQNECLSEAEVIANSVLIVTAAIDTTAGLIANTLVELMENSGAISRVQADAALISGAVDESLRHCPSAPSSTRRTPVDFELGGVRIPAGSDLFFSFTAANRDPKMFADPDIYDIDRDASALLTFGGGAHFCLGAGLARMEARVVFEELFVAGCGFALEEPIRWRANNPVVRAPERLMVSCAAIST
ncbi:MAG: cytochrome [Rhodospirillales bacterium]|nr:cytochrome [Rhodospirillales bacterium]